MSPAAKTQSRKKTKTTSAGKASKSTSKKTATKKKSATKKAPAKAAAKKAPAKKAPAKKAPARKAPAKKASTRKAPAKKASAKKAPVKQAPAKKPAAKATPAKKTSTKAPAKPKAAPKPKAPPRRRISPKQRMEEILERLDRSFGAVDVPGESRDTLERAVYLVLREKATSGTTEKALEVLREEYVDWNEVRVSRASELSRMMLGSSRPPSLRRLYPRAQRMRDMIDQIYNDRNDTSLDFLLDMKPKDQLEYLEDLDDLGMHNAYALVQWLSGDDKLVLVSSEMARVAQTLGLTETAAVTKVRKELGALIEQAELVKLQAHLNQLADLEGSWPSSLAEYTT